ncbi:MAG: DUF4396 domain-containing protein [Bacteroidetes bacterium]|nr:DUF4396 domain-containing protein [Bacteroidota bacterium]
MDVTCAQCSHSFIGQIEAKCLYFSLQIAMIIGFFTAYPMNWLLIKKQM